MRSAVGLIWSLPQWTSYAEIGHFQGELMVAVLESVDICDIFDRFSDFLVKTKHIDGRVTSSW